MTDLRFHGDAEVGAGMLDLAVNVRGTAPPAWLRAEIERSLDGLGAYPAQDAAVAAVAARHGRGPGEVLLTAGAAEAFVLLARVLRPSRAVVVHPGFTEPEAALRAADHDVERVVLLPPFDALAVPDDADLVVIGNPTNPTGLVHDVRALCRPGRVTVVDEAFADALPGETASVAGERLPGLVVVRSLTKTWALAGLRVGYLLAEPELVARLREAQPLWPVSTPALAAVVACLSPAALAEADEAARATAQERWRLEGLLRGLGVTVVPGSEAPYLLCHVPGHPEIRARLREHGIAVRRGETFPGLGPDWFRVAVRDRPSSDRLVAALWAVLAAF